MLHLEVLVCSVRKERNIRIVSNTFAICKNNTDRECESVCVCVGGGGGGERESEGIAMQHTNGLIFHLPSNLPTVDGFAAHT